MEGYVTRALGPDTWEPYAALIERNGGVWGGCWCLAFHEGDPKYDESARRARKRALVEDGRAHAALVFAGDAVVGRAQHGPRAELPRIANRKAYEAGAGGEIPADWRVACFFVDKAHRRRGVAARALRGALDLIARAGGGAVEGFPKATGGRRASAGFLWMGTLGLFDRAGFDPVRKIGKHRWVVRRNVEGAMQ